MTICKSGKRYLTAGGPTQASPPIEQDQERLGPRNVSWLSNAFDKRFATHAGNEEAIVAYLEREWDISRRLSQRSA